MSNITEIVSLQDVNKVKKKIFKIKKKIINKKFKIISKESSDNTSLQEENNDENSDKIEMKFSKYENQFIYILKKPN